ncbi:hypothetical protein LJC46_02110 [Desulfovibrio sp. OttesenSCG-928-G15]|nr:hypothetical protein [Desulfovibrio sp. OttesenSCG-928-G15]
MNIPQELEEISGMLAYLDESLTVARDIDYSDQAIVGASYVFYIMRQRLEELRAELVAEG